MDHDTTLKKFLLDKAEERWEKAEAEIQRRKEAFENRQESAAATSLNQVISKYMEKILIFQQVDLSLPYFSTKKPSRTSGKSQALKRPKSLLTSSLRWRTKTSHFSTVC